MRHPEDARYITKSLKTTVQAEAAGAAQEWFKVAHAACAHSEGGPGYDLRVIKPPR
ncbi:MAG: hypothetical protein IPK66_07740 [Rhodospirillales bacterium]|nr:hypothetical protein [Rhodospirillales bacterium]